MKCQPMSKFLNIQSISFNKFVNFENLLLLEDTNGGQP
jgi:hypothetical protein